MRNLTKYSLGTFTYNETPRLRGLLLALPIAIPIVISLVIVLNSLNFSVKSLRALKNPAVYLVIFILFFSGYSYAEAPKADLLHSIVKTTNAQTSEHDQIAAYINQVFGPDAPKAFKLLSCENSSLNPNAINRNWVKGQPGVYSSSDWGIFQVNDFYQKTQPKFLLNWKINVQIAYQLYIENGHRFNLWTCGRELGI